MTIYDAAHRYAAEGLPLLVIADTEHGPGSSRDWAAKGTALLGVRAVLAATVRIDTPAEAAYYRHGGILRYVSCVTALATDGGDIGPSACVPARPAGSY